MDFIPQELQTLLFGGSIMAIAGTVMWRSMSYILKLFQLIWNSILYTVEIPYKHYNHNISVMNMHTKNLKKIRNYEASISFYNKTEEYSPIRFFKLLWYKNTLLIFRKTRTKIDNATSSENLFNDVYYVSQFFGKSKIIDFINEATEKYSEEQNKHKDRYIYLYGNGIILKEKSFDDIHGQSAKKVKEILQANKKGNFIFYGPPGNGKSSVIAATSYLLSKNLHYLDLSSIRDDKELFLIYSNLESNSVVVIEEIDTINLTNSRDENKDISKGVTLGFLLNILDGILTRNDITFIATTNKIEKLDPALIRPGRFDHHIEFTAPTIEDAKNMYQYYNLEWDDNPNLNSFASLELQIREKLLSK